MRSSMLAAIERGRTPAIDFLNGEVVDRARERGIEVPVNARVVEMGHAIEPHEPSHVRSRRCKSRQRPGVRSQLHA